MYDAETSVLIFCCLFTTGSAWDYFLCIKYWQHHTAAETMTVSLNWESNVRIYTIYALERSGSDGNVMFVVYVLRTRASRSGYPMQTVGLIRPWRCSPLRPPSKVSTGRHSGSVVHTVALLPQDQHPDYVGLLQVLYYKPSGASG